MPAPPTPRIPPLAEEELTDEQRELVAGLMIGQAQNIFTTLVRHPGLFRKWLPFGGKLLSGKLPHRDRELLILRTGVNCQTDYEYGQHVIIAKMVGLTDEEIARVSKGPQDPGWSQDDALLLQAADELHQASAIKDTTWDALAARYNEQQLMEIPFVVGHYHMVGMVLNSIGVQPEPGVPTLPTSD
jgi:4-carboxymuconolactone decarboxylase